MIPAVLVVITIIAAGIWFLESPLPSFWQDTTTEREITESSSEEAPLTTTNETKAESLGTPPPLLKTPSSRPPSPASIKETTMPLATPAPEPPQIFTCENSNSVKSKGYVVLLGLNDNDPATKETEIRSLTAADPKVKAIFAYDYEKTTKLADISKDFIAKFNAFISKYQPEEVVIIGRSAGGTIAAYSAQSLVLPGMAELHTIASPLRGYGLGDFLAGVFVGETRGLEREIAVGFTPFLPAPKNFKVYHHKTVADSEYKSQCGEFAEFCDVRAIQNNNLSDSKEFYYPQYDHDTIMLAITRKVVACRSGPAGNFSNEN